jgi:hypothetical protein
MKKKSLIGYLPKNWDLQVYERYGKESLCAVALSQYNGLYFYHPVRTQRYCNDKNDEVKVKITIEEL